MMKVLIIFITSIFILFSCESSSNRKIKLAGISSNKPGTALATSSVIKILPQDQSSIAIINFRNETGDPALQWLERGLADMFVTELSQSPYLNIINMKNLAELAEQSNISEKDLFNPTIALNLARKAKTDLLLAGKFYQVNDSMYIEVELRDTHSQKFIRKEVVNGLGMEQLFAMVDNLSEKVRTKIRGDLEEVQSDPINLVEMTTSVEAFRCYSNALENHEKFFFDESEKWIEKAVQIDTNFAAGYLFLAKIKLLLNKIDEAKAAVTQAKKRIEKLSLADKYQMELLELRFNYDRKKLLSKLQEAVQQFPTNIDFHMDLGRVYREDGDYKNAIEQFEIVRELRPNKKTIYNELAYAHALRQDYKTSLDFIETYKKMAPDEPNPYDSAGEILMFAGRYKEAIPQLKKSLEIDPTFYLSAEKLGRIYTEFGDYDKALKYFNMADKYAGIVKMSELTDWRKITLYWKSGQINKALKLVDQIEAERNSNLKLPNTSTVHTKAFIYNSIGDQQKAEDVYEACFKVFEENADSLTSYMDIDRFMGILLLSHVDPDKAMNLLDRIHKNTTDEKSIALLNLVSGVIAIRADNMDKAEKYFLSDKEAQIKLITENNNERWSQLWKFVFEAVQNYNSPKLAEKLGEDLLEIGEQDNRNDLKLIGKIIAAIYYQKVAGKDKVEHAFSDIGVPLENKWQVCGPYHIKTDFAFNYPFAPESDKKEDIPWHIVNDGVNDGYIDLKSTLKNPYWATAYAETYIYSPEEQPVEIRVGGSESFKIWLNDNFILSRLSDGDLPFDAVQAKVVLHPGNNKLMLKVNNHTYEWGFLCRITDENGNGIENIKFYHPQEIDRNYAVK